MPTDSPSAPAVSGPRHRAPDRDRLGDYLTASWAAPHIPVLVLLGLVAHQPEPAAPSAAPAAATPDLPLVQARHLFTRSSERRTAMHNLTEVPTMSVEFARVDYRTTPEYYFETERITDPLVLHLLDRCPTVFGLKKAVTDLLAGQDEIALPASEGVIEPGATVRGQVIVAAGAVIAEGAFVTGPALICPGAVIEAGARVRDNTVIGPDCRIGFGAEVTRSLLVGGVFMKHTSFVGDSVLGLGVNIGAFVSTTGLRCTSGPVREPATEEVCAHLDGHRIATGQTKFGAVIGDGVILPAGTVLQPATLIGAHTVLYPKTQVGGFFPAGSQGR
ncbi:LbetaH domain-containing protein [Peterkaempfera bronchialis]|uniref:Mannose-1-phosphate guanyltransferase C-terminal domain-containing protein n=1 Tax=Peterkaempfera bronchialis TaxID=2126346 RepID=A0A345ST47_9ACTN|nr:hypothetical protein [Peterkaempfera bronchialis]AXI76902.1 hypothetical protein C7M71_004990 [Peterkaempfera bronchialis]